MGAERVVVHVPERRWIRAMAALLGAAALPLLSACGMAPPRWEARSIREVPGLRVETDGPAALLDPPIAQFRALRETLRGTSFAALADATLPDAVTLFVFATSEEWDRARGRLKRAAGMYVPFYHAIFLPRGCTSQDIRHEFVHALHAKTVRHTPPPWLEEGLADWLSMGRRSIRNDFQFDIAVEDFKKRSGELTVASALDATMSDVYAVESELYYSRAYVLVRALSDDPTLGPRFTDYVLHAARVGDRMDELAAALGTSKDAVCDLYDRVQSEIAAESGIRVMKRGRGPAH